MDEITKKLLEYEERLAKRDAAKHQVRSEAEEHEASRKTVEQAEEAYNERHPKIPADS